MGFFLVLFSLAFLGALATATFAGALPLWIAATYFAVSLVSIPVYAWDKYKARRTGQRISEKTLHLFELAGGWPGALLAQQIFRHKTKKISHQRFFWLIVALHLVAWAWLLFPR